MNWPCGVQVPASIIHSHIPDHYVKQRTEWKGNHDGYV
jgi:hypothetical protein